jgi:hypothetical protein
MERISVSVRVTSVVDETRDIAADENEAVVGINAGL